MAGTPDHPTSRRPMWLYLTRPDVSVDAAVAALQAEVLAGAIIRAWIAFDALDLPSDADVQRAMWRSVL